MKRKVNKKSESFDLIKFTPRKQSMIVQANEQGFFRPSDSPVKPSFSNYEQSKRRICHLQLPKIHANQTNNDHSNTKVHKAQIQSQKSHSRLNNRLLLMGYQYRKDTGTLRCSRQNYNISEMISQDNVIEKFADPLNIFTKKFHTSWEHINDRSGLGYTFFYSFGFAYCLMEKKKIMIYVEQGNNSRMVKEIFRKRPQITVTNDKKEANLVWTRFCDYQSAKLTSKFKEEKIKPKRDYSQKLHTQEEQSQPRLSKSIGVNQYGHIKEEKVKKSYINFENYLETESHHSHWHHNEQIEKILLIQDFRYHNHLQNHHQISDKRSLFKNLEAYCKKQKLEIFSIVPITYEYLRSSLKDYRSGETSANFLNQAIKDTGMWFIKPGEDTNRGDGISIAQGREKIQKQVVKLLQSGKTAIVQSYIDPLLYKNRKFDIRCYALVISFRGKLKAYWYRQGYIRTCSKQFNYDPTDLYAHLTNDAIQKKSPLYGKYEQSNKLSYNDLQNYMKSKQLSFGEVSDNMKQLALYSIKAAEDKLKCQKNQISFQIFGYDFLIDKKGKVWLIEINTNPCLQFTGSLTSRIIWHMVDNSFKICLDPFLQHFVGQSYRDQPSRLLQDNKYQCII